MTAHQLIPGGFRPRGDDQTEVLQWRLRRLLAAGFPPPLALRLASAPGVDLHALLGLVDRGCPPELAARILDPDPGQGA